MTRPHLAALAAVLAVLAVLLAVFQSEGNGTDRALATPEAPEVVVDDSPAAALGVGATRREGVGAPAESVDTAPAEEPPAEEDAFDGVAGRVVGPDGAPAAGATVLLLRDGFVPDAEQVAAALLDAPDAPQRTVAGRDGRFEFRGLRAEEQVALLAGDAGRLTAPDATPTVAGERDVVVALRDVWTVRARFRGPGGAELDVHPAFGAGGHSHRSDALPEKLSGHRDGWLQLAGAPADALHEEYPRSLLVASAPADPPVIPPTLEVRVHVVGYEKRNATLELAPLVHGLREQLVELTPSAQPVGRLHVELVGSRFDPSLDRGAGRAPYITLYPIEGGELRRVLLDRLPVAGAVVDDMPVGRYSVQLEGAGGRLEPETPAVIDVREREQAHVRFDFGRAAALVLEPDSGPEAGPVTLMVVWGRRPHEGGGESFASSLAQMHGEPPRVYPVAPGEYEFYVLDPDGMLIGSVGESGTVEHPFYGRGVSLELAPGEDRRARLVRSE